jgi:hypothetical protein
LAVVRAGFFDDAQNGDGRPALAAIGKIVAS